MRLMTGKIRNLGSIIVDELRYDFIKEAILYIGHGQRLLDLGCGIKPFQHLYENHIDECIGVDAPFSLHDKGKVEVHALGHALPFMDEVFDVVLCTEVLEHVPEPEAVLREIRRVLKNGGRLIMTTPFLVPLHEEPYDFYRYTAYGLKYLCEKQNLGVAMLLPFSGLAGVTLSFLVQAQLKFWYLIGRFSRIPGVYTVYNPFIFLLVYLPQRLYLGILSMINRIGALKAVHEKLCYTTKGYGLVAFKK